MIHLFLNGVPVLLLKKIFEKKFNQYILNLLAAESGAALCSPKLF